jgi:glutamyl/glutaminyl-tRNA synthetase
MDEVRGNITFDTTELGDFVIGRSIDDPLYHFAVVVDDSDMGITHVIRGEDHISNTPRQILIQEALGLARPIYAHLPLILAPDRSKLSKRHGAVSLLEYRQEGFLPGAILNYLALLGWNPGDDREDFSLAELIPLFDLSRVQKSGAVFDRVKFLDINQRYMRRLPDEEFIALGNFTQTDADAIAKAVPLMKERAQTFAEARGMLDGELAFLFAAQTLDLATLTAKNVAGAPKGAKEHLSSFVSMIEALLPFPTADDAKAALMPYADTIPKEEGGRGAALWPLRYALSGKERSPDPFTILSLLGRDESRARLASALAILE